MKRVLLVGGGSGGHVTPNIAIVDSLRDCGFEVHYAGGRTGLERDLIVRCEIEYHVVSSGKYTRGELLKSIYNVPRVVFGLCQAIKLLAFLRPDVVFSKGGYASFPVAAAAIMYRIPLVIHESDKTFGLANALLVPFAAKVCCGFRATADRHNHSHVQWTGTPVRRRLFDGKRELGLRICAFPSGRCKPVLLVIGGSQGAAGLNEAVRGALDEILPRYNVCHICGEGNGDETLANTPGYTQITFAHDELPHLLACADVVVTRAGATTLLELVALRKRCIVVPLSGRVSRGDQLENAQWISDLGFASTVENGELSPARLVEELARATTRKCKPTASSREANEGTIAEIVGLICEASESH